LLNTAVFLTVSNAAVLLTVFIAAVLLIVSDAAILLTATQTAVLLTDSQVTPYCSLVNCFLRAILRGLLAVDGELIPTKPIQATVLPSMISILS
jgi:hypothetical protein